MTRRLTSFLTSILPFLLLTAVVLLVYRQLVFSNLILARGDTYLYFYPYWQAAADALRAGRIPLWNPDLFMGAPLLANSQVGFFYPLNWPLWLLLETPYAVSASIVLHVLIACFGMYICARRALRLSPTGAIIAALMFGLGGYFSAQVEHVNQVQGLAWMPWLMVAASNWQDVLNNRRLMFRRAALIAFFFGLQLLAGHTQTTFISGIGIGIWTGVQLLLMPQGENKSPWMRRFLLGLVVALGALIVGVIVAVLIAGAQLLPTFELTQLSRRQGGLPIDEALSFSLHPLLFARAMLPTYGQLPFSEYIAYVPIAGLILAVIGIGTSLKKRLLWPAIALLLLGLFLAFGEYNPIFKNYIIKLPGFSLFRVPARWMVLYGFGIALCAGTGWDAVSRAVTRDDSDSKPWSQVQLWAVVGMVIVIGLMGLVPYSTELGLTGIPMPPESPADIPRFTLWIGWLFELAACVVVFMLAGPRWRVGRYLLWVPIVVGLVWAQRSLLNGALTTPEAYFDVRSAVARLMVSAENARANNQPTPRFLSISKGYFDPGDQGELDSIYADTLTEDQLYRFTVTTKDREIIVPNLTLSFGLSAIDGFDGGLLPLGDYATMVGLMLPAGVETIDGRLREFLTFIPDAQWLDLFGVRHLITDRTGDNFYQFEDDNVFFDLQQRELLTPGETLQIGFLPPYQSTELWIVAEGETGIVRMTVDGVVEEISAEKIADTLFRATWPTPLDPDSIELVATDSDWMIAGVSLVDSEAHSYRELVPGNYRSVHKGDVKIYENLDVLPRAFTVNNWSYVPDVAAAVATFGQNLPYDFATIEGNGSDVAGTGEAADVTVTSYAPEKIILQVDAPDDALLVVTEAFYPGWVATIDGDSAEIVKADGMFRGLFVEAGTQEVVMTFEPQSLRNGFLMTAGGLLLLLGLAFFGRKMAK